MAKSRVANGAPAAEKLGWHLGVQAYTFNHYTFYEAVDKTESLGLHYIEIFPGQQASADNPDVKVDHEMDKSARQEVKQKLDAAGVRPACYGVISLTEDEKEGRTVFDFAAEMGVETIVSEPSAGSFDLLDKLCEEYKINIAIHNHPKPSTYWDPNIVLAACEGHSKRIGSCSDTGHWMRSNINPLDALKMLEGRIKSLHVKDLNHYGEEGTHDVPWGEGQANVKALLAELLRQGVEAVFSIEYEYHWETSVPEIAKCVEYFDKTAAELAKNA